LKTGDTFEANSGVIHCGHVLEVLQSMDDESVDCAVTSPPYYGLRNYGTEKIVWGGRDLCEHEWDDGQFCTKCSAWLGHLGLEPTPTLFVQHLTDIFREVNRVLKSTGTLWLNIGDSYYNYRPGKGQVMGIQTLANGNRKDQPIDCPRRGNKITSGDPNMYKLRKDLTSEQISYVLSELSKANST